MKKILFITLLFTASCAANSAPTAIDNTPGTQTTNEYTAKYPCSQWDSRKGACMEK